MFHTVQTAYFQWYLSPITANIVELFHFTAKILKEIVRNRKCVTELTPLPDHEIYDICTGLRNDTTDQKSYFMEIKKKFVTL